MLRVTVESDLKRLETTLDRVSAATRKDMRVVLADATKSLLIGGNGVKGLYQEFRELRPSADGDIRSAPWGIGRTFRKYGERGSVGVSIAAQKRAEALLQGNPSLLFRLGGRGALKKPDPLVVSTKTGRTVAFRPGINQRPVYATQRVPGAVRLNLRALSVYYELQGRASGIGYSAAQFAIQRATLSANLASAANSGGGLTATQFNDAGREIGRVDYSPEYARIQGFLEHRGPVDAISARVINAVLADREAYIERTVLKRLSQL